MNQDRIDQLVHLMNTSWEASTHHFETDLVFTVDEVKEYIEIDAIDEEYSLEGWGRETHNRWLHYLDSKEKLPPETMAIEKSVVESALRKGSNNLMAHFDFDPITMQWSPVEGIKPPQFYDTLSDLMSLQTGLDKAIDESSWIVGNIAACAQDHLEDDYDPSMVSQATGKSIKTIQMYTSVFRAFQGRRVHGVSFSAHKEIRYIKGLPIDEAILCLHTARDNNLNLSDTKHLGRVVAAELANGKEEAIKEITPDHLHEAQFGAKSLTLFIVMKADGTLCRKQSISDGLLASAKFIAMVNPKPKIIKGEIK